MAALSNIITPTNVLTAANTVTLTNKTINASNNTITNVSLTTGVTGTLPIANGGTGETTRQAAIDALAGAVTSGQYLRGNGTDVVMSAIQAADVPTLNQNTTGTAANVSGTVAVSNGGTGQTTLTGLPLPQPVITQNMQVIGSGTTAVASRVYVLTASLTLTLPASPAAGNWVSVSNRSGTTTPVIARNGQNIMNLAEDMTIDNSTASFTLTFADATRGWVLTL
jgi:hypothetical protein